jgi:hypothetical protein
MAVTTTKSFQKPIQAYYGHLQAFAAHDVGHELAVRTAFQTLLSETARPFRWTLIPEETMRGQFRDHPSGWDDAGR